MTITVDLDAKTQLKQTNNNSQAMHMSLSVFYFDVYCSLLFIWAM